jgi:hypothetical protein
LVKRQKKKRGGSMAHVHIAGKLKFGAERKGKKGKKRI